MKTDTRGKTLANVHIITRSANPKTGPIPVTYRPVSTCAHDCVFLPADQAENLVAEGKRSPDLPALGGCYGTGRIFGMARRYAAEVSRSDIRAKLASVAPSARFLRDRVVGDIVTDSGDIDHDYVADIAELALEADLIPYGYTHAWHAMTAEDVTRIAETGYVMNASCETRADVRDAIDLGIPVTITSDLVDDGEEFIRPDGKTLRVVTCPAQTHKNVTCASCGLCAKPERAAVVRFLIHGIARKRAAAAVTTREEASSCTERT